MKTPFRFRSKTKMNRAQAASLDQSGQGLTEYLILLLLIAVFSIGAAQILGKTVKEKLELAQRHIRSDVKLEE